MCKKIRLSHYIKRAVKKTALFLVKTTFTEILKQAINKWFESLFK